MRSVIFTYKILHVQIIELWKNKTIIKLELIMHKARKEFTVSNLYSKIKIMKKKTIAIIQCILYLTAPYIALQLCSINRSLVGEFFIIFFILLTISFFTLIMYILDNFERKKFFLVIKSIFFVVLTFRKTAITSFRKTIIFLKNI